LQTDKQALESEAQKLQPPEGDEPDSWMAVVNEKDQWEKGARKWEKLYQELSASSESDRASYNEQLADLKAGEIDNTSEVDNLNRRLEQLQSTYDSIQGGDAPKLADLKHAYDEQSVKFDAMLSQLDQKDGLLEEAILQRQDLEERLTQQMDHVRADVNQEREAAAESRQQLGQTQLDHRDLLKSYRELNDKYIQLKESSGIRHVPAQPSQATEPVMMTEPDPSTKSEPKMKKRLALGKKKSIVVNPEPEAKAQPAEAKAAAPEKEIAAPPAEACEPKTVAPDKAPQKNGKRKQKKKKSGLRLK
jgi:hypothetical protein